MSGTIADKIAFWAMLDKAVLWRGNGDVEVGIESLVSEYAMPGPYAEHLRQRAARRSPADTAALMQVIAGEVNGPYVPPFK